MCFPTKTPSVKILEKTSYLPKVSICLPAESKIYIKYLGLTHLSYKIKYNKLYERT